MASINYNDSRFAKVTNDKNAALKEVNNLYNGMVNNSDKYYNDLKNAASDYEKKQSELQQANTDFAIEKIEQSKDWAKQDYTKEQKASYVDYQKGVNEYGVNAEKMAANGLDQSGYAESSRVNMFNEYQNRIATARESFNRTIVDYDNQIKEAQLANNSALAEIAYNSLKERLELSLEGFQYKNTLLQQQLNAKNDVEDRYYTRWQDVVNQINTENQLEEEKRQFNLQMAASRSSSRGGSSGGSSRSSSGGSSGSGNKLTTAYYSGDYNLDCQNGTFSNGYQPNNVGGSKLTSSGNKTKVTATTLQGTKTTVTQNVWYAKDTGKYYVWDGSNNKYYETNSKGVRK